MGGICLFCWLVLTHARECGCGCSGVLGQDGDVEYDAFDEAELVGLGEEAEAEAAGGFMYSHKDAVVTTLFQSHPEKELPPGERVDLLIGFQNEGEMMFNITHVFASLVNVRDYSSHVENYTVYEYGVNVHAGQEATVTYVFAPNENFDPADFGLTVLVYYSDVEGNMWVSAAYNSTVSVVEAPALVDASTAFQYVAFGLLALTIAYVVYTSRSGSGSSSRAAVAIETGTTKSMTQDQVDFLPAHLKKSAKKKSKSGKKSQKKK